MSGARGRAVAPWAVGVFLAALAARLAFLFLVDQPLLYSHQYNYFASALRIAEHPHPLSYILTSDEWRTWDQHWTIAPLYHVFAAGVFRLFGPHLLPLQLLQCLFDSLAAVGVAFLGRRVAGPRGALAGLVYGLHWPAFEMPSWTMTENVHTLLFVAGVALLAADDPHRSPRLRLVGGGLLLGLSALARSVSAGFLGLAALARLGSSGLRRGWRPAALLLASGLAVILPWTARNFVLGEHVLIESAAFENLWWANNFVDKEHFRRQQQVVFGQPTPEAQRAAALHFALRGIRRNPEMFAEKVWSNFRHFLRPDWLDSFLRVERPMPPWQNAAGIVLEDLVLIAGVPLFVVFLFAGRPTAARTLIVVWTSYYLFMIVVVFHNELRYRSALIPFALAGAAGGLAALADPAARGRLRTRIALGVGLALSAMMLGPYLPRAARALGAHLAARAAAAALDRGDLTAADQAAVAAAAKDATSPRPWLEHGRRLAGTGHVSEAIEAYRKAARVGTPAAFVPAVVLPRLLAQAGRAEEASRALRDADFLSWNTDPWMALETAWRELPPPRSDEILVGQGDYGAVRGFFHPRGGDPQTTRRFLTWNRYDPPGERPPPGPHRWTRQRAWLRLVPTRSAEAYDVTLVMGSPFPSPLPSPRVEVRASGGAVVRFTLSPEIRPYTVRATPRAGDPILVRIDAPTWCRLGEPAEQGIRVDRMAVAPAR